MNSLERANLLKCEADYLMDALQIRAIYAPYGEVIVSGSYFLDTMAYPDVDLYVASMSWEDFVNAGAQLAALPLVSELHFSKKAFPDLPGGLYFKPYIEHGDWGRPWKFDIWSVDPSISKSKMVDMYRFQNLMTPAMRELIVTYKLSIINEEGRTPIFSGYFTYKAVLDYGLRKFDEITQFLQENGVKVG